LAGRVLRTRRGRLGEPALPDFILFPGNKKAPTHGEKGLTKLAHASHFPLTPVRAGIGTWPLRTHSEPVAVASSGQSLSHSAWDRCINGCG